MGFIPELAAEHLDFSNLQRENIKHHHEDLTRKEGDIAIQLRYQESQKQGHQKEEIRILLELQSTADPRMPLRLWESWIRACADAPMRQALRSFVREFVWHGPVQGLG